MDKDTAKQIGIALVGSLLISAVLYLFTSISELKHNQDTENSTAKAERTQIKSELVNIWEMKNADIKQQGQALQMFYEFQLKQERDNSDRKGDLKDFQIEYYKNELEKANK